MTYTHDPEGSPLTEVIPVPIPAETETLNYTYNARGELVDSIYTPNSGLIYPHYRSDTGGGCVTRASIPLDGSYVPGTTPPDPLVDSRTCATVSNGMMGSVDYNTSSFPSGSTGAFTFDTAGRLLTKIQTTSTFTAPDPTGTGNKQGGSVPGSAITAVVTTNTLYDAENHTVSRQATTVRTKTKSGHRIGLHDDDDRGSHDARMGTERTSSDRLGRNERRRDIALGRRHRALRDGRLGERRRLQSGFGRRGHATRYTMERTHRLCARAAGVIIGSTNTNGTSGLMPMDPSDGTMVPGTGASPGYVSSSMPIMPYTRPDGFTIGDIQINGVRAFDPALGSWTTPDAFEGDIHDPASQQKYMWNRGNPVDYSDPSGYCVTAQSLPLCIWAGAQAAATSVGGAVILVLGLAGDSPQQPIDQVLLAANKAKLDSIDSWRKQIQKHQDKIRGSTAPNEAGLRDHWRREIENFRKQIDEAYKQLDKNKRDKRTEQNMRPGDDSADEGGKEKQ